MTFSGHQERAPGVVAAAWERRRAGDKAGVNTVVYTSPFVPPEWMAAYGARPRRIQPEPHAAAPSAGPLAGLCPYARAMVGTLTTGADGDAAVLTTTCDQMRRAAEWAAMNSRLPVFLMNVPATWQTAAAVRLYRDELLRLGRFLVRHGATEPSHEILCRTMETYDTKRAELRGALGALSPRRANDAVATFSLKWQADTPPVRPAGALRGVPVAVVGGPLLRGDSEVFDIIEEAGGRVVLDATESGVRGPPAPFNRRRLRDDPLMELVEAYFGAIPDAFRRPDDALHAYLTREVAAGAARGIIVWRYLWCDHWAAFVPRLREATGLPVLDLDVSVDKGHLARVSNRIQAFLEILT